jgi:cardiolipin synthase
VDVKLLQPAKTDLPIVQLITRGDYPRWLAGGLLVYEYQPRVLHAKLAIIDDEWSTVGTFNAITPGLWWANETNLIIVDRSFASAVYRGLERLASRASCRGRARRGRRAGAPRL